MREFSPNERRIIKDHLINGAGLSSLLSDNFRLRSKLMLTIFIDGSYKFQFTSATLTKETAYAELVDLVLLLEYLIKEGLVIPYPAPVVHMRDYKNRDEHISLGDDQKEANWIWLSTIHSEYIGDFVKRHENSTFKATASLKALAERNFITQEELRHQQALFQSREANTSTRRLAIAAAIIATISAFFQIQSSNRTITQNERLIKITEKGNVKDSIAFQAIELKHQNTKNELEKSNLTTAKYQAKLDSINLEIRRIKAKSR